MTDNSTVKLSNEDFENHKQPEIHEETITIDEPSGEENQIEVGEEEGESDDVFDPKQRVRMKSSVEIDKDLSRFLSDFYSYYEEKGFSCVLLKEISKIMIPFSINLLTFIILNHINLMGLLRCKGEECSRIPIFINFGFFLDYSWTNYLCIIFCLGILVYVAVLCYFSWLFVYRMYKIKQFINIELKIDEDAIKTIPWGELLDILIKQNVEKAIFGEDVDALDITNSIMRVDNFIIALEHCSVLDLRLPVIGEPILPEAVVTNFRIILEKLFVNKKKELKSDFMHPASEYLKRQFFIYGILNLLFSPFIFVYVIIKVFFTYFAEFHTNKTFFFKRNWSTLAKWRFRSYSELPHEFNQRMRRAEEYADFYCGQFPSPIISIIGKNIMFFASAFAAIIIIFTTFKNPLLIHMTFLGQNLLWWSVLLFAVFSAASGQVIGVYDVFKPQKYLNKVGRHTHFLPEDWKSKAKEPEVLSEFKGNWYQTKLKWFLIEIFSVFITPYFFLFKFPEKSSILVEFIKSVSEKEDKRVTKFLKGGIVCGFSTFNFADFRSFKLTMKDHLPTGSIVTYKIRMKGDGKMEKSFLLFKMNHTKWNGNVNMGKYSENLIGSLNILARKKTVEKREELKKGLPLVREDEELIKFNDEEYSDGEDEKKKKLRKSQSDDVADDPDLAKTMLSVLIHENGDVIRRSVENFSRTSMGDGNDTKVDFFDAQSFNEEGEGKD